MTPKRTILRSKVARRIFLQFVVCALLPLGVLAVFVFVRVTDQLVRSACRNLERECKSSGMAIADRLGLMEAELGFYLSKHDGDDDVGPRPRSAPSQDHSSPRFRGVSIVREDGSVHTVSGEPTQLPDLGPEEREHLSREGALVVTDRRGDGHTRIFLIESAARAGRAIMLVAEIDGRYLWDEGWFDATHEAPAAIYDSGGPLHATRAGLLPEGVVGAALAGNRSLGNFTWEVDGRAFVGAHWTLFLRQHYGIAWTLVRSESRAALIAPMRGFHQIFALVLLLTFLIVTLLGISQIRRSTIPIAMLHQATRRVAEGDLESRVLLASEDEFGELADSFNAMADQIRDRTDRMQRAYKAKSDFLARMSHEIRTPMTSILGYADLCRAEDCSESQRADGLDIIHASGAHLLALISDILDVSKIEAGRMMVESTSCSPGRLAAEVVAMLRERAEDKGLDLLLKAEGPIPESIQTDPGRLRQILLNLVGNAVKFTDRGRVRLALRLERSPDLARMCFEIADTGIGLPGESDQVDRLFEPFGQADTSMSRRQGGTGLGLTISRSIARLLKGDIECQNRRDGGSVFTVVVDPGPLQGVAMTESPFDLDLSEPAAALPSRHFDGPSPRVLLAEDVAVNRLLVVKLLMREGARVDQAENGLIAYEKAKQAMERNEPYDLVLMDIQMPEMDGYEATAKLRQEGYRRPIVALTSHAVAGERERCISAGCDDFANKPIAQRSLAELLHRYCGPRTEPQRRSSA